MAQDIEGRVARGSYYQLLKACTHVPFEGEELSDGSLEMYCADLRDGYAKFRFCTPTRPGSDTQPSDPRDDPEQSA
ncbi:hypothetical protein ACWEPH_25970 [Nocardia beijingensis]|uniref:hypothetical protein n=1 Tax=Nocardia beijingensis TaxID=95162 RepID=UPI0033F935DC